MTYDAYGSGMNHASARPASVKAMTATTAAHVGPMAGVRIAASHNHMRHLRVVMVAR